MISATGTTGQKSGSMLRIAPSLDLDHSSQEIWQAARLSDLDRYLAALRFPYEHRDAMMSVLAFAGEVKKIPELVREPMMGQIRLQWWRDALSETGLTTRYGNPIADALCETVLSYDLPIPLLLGYIDAHEFHFTNQPMPNQQALTAYLVKTESALFQIALRILINQRPALLSKITESDRVILLAGECFGRARMLAELPKVMHREPSLLPSSARADWKRNPRGMMGQSVRLLEQMDKRIKKLCRKVPQGIKPPTARAVLPLRLAPAYLTAAKHPRRDPLSELTSINPLGRVWTIWRHSFSRTI